MKTIILNSSGGGTDSGYTGNGIVEKNVTLKISQEIKKVLDKYNLNVVLLRNDDSTISYDERIKKVKNGYNKEDTIIISNTLQAGTDQGIDIIYPINTDDSLAKLIATNLSKYNKTDYFQYKWVVNTTKDYYYITRELEGYNTIIIRYAHIGNSEDIRILKERLVEIANSVASSLLSFLGITELKNEINNVTYVVQKGDSLWGIAKKFNTTVEKLKLINNKKSDFLSIGEILKISDNVYVVQKGDSLWGIAKKYNTTVAALKSANNLKSDLISINQKLIIP